MVSSIIGNCGFDKENCVKKIPYDSRKDIDCAKCKILSPCPKRVLVECGIPGSETSFFNTGQTINTALVTVDTSCFIKPVVDIRFSSQIDVVLQPDDEITPPETAEVVLRFDLICNADGRGDISVGSWTYRRFLTRSTATDISAQRLETTDTFSFNKCLFPKSCGGCIDYFVRITAIKISVNNEVI